MKYISLNDYFERVEDIGSNICSIIQTQDINSACEQLQCFIKKNIFCSTIDLVNNPGFFLINGLSEYNNDSCSINISQIRELKNFLYQTSIVDKKVVIITYAENMTVNAANGCLKFLEDFSINTYIFFITHNLYLLLPTIRSRCNKIYLFDKYVINYQEYITNLSLVFNRMSIVENITKELWYKISNVIISFLLRIIKYSMQYQIQLYEQELEIIKRFRYFDTLYLVKKYDKVAYLIDNTFNFDLSIDATYLLIINIILDL